MRHLLIGIIRIYQLLLSSFLIIFSLNNGAGCRFYPSCSEYTKLSLQRFGVKRGLWLAGRRILRCHPWARGGIDYPLKLTS